MGIHPARNTHGDTRTYQNYLPFGNIKMPKQKRDGKNAFVFYSIDAVTGEYIDPIAPRATIDDVSGFPIPGGAIGFQDGMMKDVRRSQDTWEKYWRDEVNDVFIGYDPALGVQQIPAGYKDD